MPSKAVCACVCVCVCVCACVCFSAENKKLRKTVSNSEIVKNFVYTYKQRSKQYTSKVQLNTKVGTKWNLLTSDMTISWHLRISEPLGLMIDCSNFMYCWWRHLAVARTKCCTTEVLTSLHSALLSRKIARTVSASSSCCVNTDSNLFHSLAVQGIATSTSVCLSVCLFVHRC